MAGKKLTRSGHDILSVSLVRSSSLWCWRWSTRQGYLVIGAVGQSIMPYDASCTNLLTRGFFFGGDSYSLHMFIFHFVPSISPHKVYRLDSPRNHSVSKIRVNASMQDSEGKVSAFRRKGGKRQQERKQTEVVSSDAGSFKVGVEFFPWIFNHQC